MPLLLIPSDLPPGSRALVPLGELSDALVELPGAPLACPAPLRVLQLAEELREVLEVQHGPEEVDLLRRHIPAETAHMLLMWLGHGLAVSTIENARKHHGDTFLKLHPSPLHTNILI